MNELHHFLGIAQRVEQLSNSFQPELACSVFVAQRVKKLN
jgi:hypothetical protein